MERLTFVSSEKEIFDDFKNSFETYLYNTRKFLDLRPAEKRVTYCIVNKENQVKEAQVHFFLEGGTAYSIFKSPFGSFEFNVGLSLPLLRSFYDYIEEDFVRRKVCRVIIKNYAEVYAPDHVSKITDLLLNKSFEVGVSEINHHIYTSESPGLVLKKMKKIRLNRCHNAGFLFSEVESDKVHEVVDYIIDKRKEKAYSFSMDKEELMYSYRSLGGAMKAFTIKNNEHIIAGTIAIIVNSRVLYNFALASSQEYASFSPAVMLLDGLYRYCKVQQIKVLDLGTSVLNGYPMPGLVKFKESVGGIAGSKLTFQKTLIS